MPPCGSKRGSRPALLIARLAALVVLWPYGSAVAQYRFDHWTADNGLPQNSVRDIVQTRDGYLWFATFDGLVRFDGVRFTVFNKGNSPGMAGNRFTWLFEDRFGDLWATLDTGEEYSAPTDGVTAVVRGGDGGLAVVAGGSLWIDPPPDVVDPPDWVELPLDPAHGLAGADVRPLSTGDDLYVLAVDRGRVQILRWVPES